MSRIRLTAETFCQLAAPEGRRAEYFDESLHGLSVRVSPAGRKSFCVLYRSGRHVHTLGTYPVLGLFRERTLARAALAEAAMGRGPALAKRARRFGIAPRTTSPRADIRELLDAVVVRGAPFEANATHALLRKMFNWAIGCDLVEKNPCFGLPRPTKERRRHRVLSEADLRTFWTALSDEPSVIRRIIRTACSHLMPSKQPDADDSPSSRCQEPATSSSRLLDSTPLSPSSHAHARRLPTDRHLPNPTP